MAPKTKYRTHTFVVAPEDRELRLDQLLAKHVEELSRRKARVVLDIGGVFVGSKRVKAASRKVRPGKTVRVHLGGAIANATGRVGGSARSADEDRLPDYVVVHKDDDVVVINKPAGLITAPTPESDRNNVVSLLQKTLLCDIFVVHRLDMATSGLLVLALNEGANKHLSEQFRQHTAHRVYEAIALGDAAKVLPLVSEPVQGKPAVTHFTMMHHYQTGDDLWCHLQARLETGRQHQVRLHCRHVGLPVAGDTLYGGKLPKAMAPPQMALHAKELGFCHPRTREDLRFDVPWTVQMEAWIDTLRGKSLSIS